MAAGTTLYTLSVELADVDRGVYAPLELKLARHPSETAEYMLTRLLAYCLEYGEGIAFTDGVSAVDEPAVLGPRPDRPGHRLDRGRCAFARTRAQGAQTRPAHGDLHP